MASYVNSGSTFSGLKSDTIRRYTTSDGREFIETKTICGEIREIDGLLGGQSDPSGVAKLRVEGFGLRDQLRKELSESRCRKNSALLPKRQQAQLRLTEIEELLMVAEGAAPQTLAAD